MSTYNKVYDFTNENVSCLETLYTFENSKVLSVVGSGDQYFASILNGARQVDLFDINQTSYLYFILKFYSIKELTFEEFYELFVKKNFYNIKIYNKLENILPLEVLKYYKFLINNYELNKDLIFKGDGVNLLTKKNQKYYFENKNTVIPYFLKEKYYKLQEILNNVSLPKFYNTSICELKTNTKYDVLLTSNIYYHVPLDIFDYVRLLKNFDIPQIQAGYDWYGIDLEAFKCMGCIVNKVLPSSPSEFNKNFNYIYSIKKTFNRS